MMKTTAPLIREIDAYLKANPGISESTLGREAVNDGKLVGRLRSGGRCWPETEERIRSFMGANKFPTVRRKVAA